MLNIKKLTLNAAILSLLLSGSSLITLTNANAVTVATTTTRTVVNESPSYPVVTVVTPAPVKVSTPAPSTELKVTPGKVVPTKPVPASILREKPDAPVNLCTTKWDAVMAARANYTLAAKEYVFTNKTPDLVIDLAYNNLKADAAAVDAAVAAYDSCMKTEKQALADKKAEERDAANAKLGIKSCSELSKDLAPLKKAADEMTALRQKYPTLPTTETDLNKLLSNPKVSASDKEIVKKAIAIKALIGDKGEKYTVANNTYTKYCK